MEIKKILVTGATGVAGSEIIREFVRNKYPVKALVRNLSKANYLSYFPNVEVIQGDMSQANTLKKAFEDVDVVMISSSTSDMLETQ